MPEGDTIRRAAARLAPLLIGQQIERAQSRWPSAAFGLRGRRILELEPIGKHLWIVLDDGNAIRIHLGLHGQWRIVPPGEEVRGSLGNIALRLDLATATVLCIGAPTVERVPARLRPIHPVLAALGPDVLADPFDPEAVLPRIAASPAASIAEVLLDQRVACGIGNVYKCEVLFLRRVHPFDPPSALDAEAWIALYRTASELMRRNLGGGPRITTSDDVRSRAWVYGRSGRPCLRCGTRIARRTSGDGLPRMSWWCPTCQAPRGERVR